MSTPANPSSLYDQVKKASDYIASRVDLSDPPQVGIVCGSGLGSLCDHVKDAVFVPYADIPGFPNTTVAGHKGNLVFGTLEGCRIVAMQGRIHPYEGHDLKKVTLPVRVMKEVGIKTLMLTNAVGGLNPLLKPGNLMLVQDHMCVPNLGLNGPLVGENDPRLGPRFPGTVNLYDRKLRSLVKETAESLGIQLHQGIYIMVSGPQYETPAENRMLRMMGADSVGMSLAHETVVARHAGLKVIAVNLITNISQTDSEAKEEMDLHEEVLEAAAQAANKLTTLFKAIIKKL